MTAHVRAGERLKRELERSAEQAGCTVDWVVEHSRPWSSPSFVGGTHELLLIVEGEAMTAWLDMLDEDAVYLPGFVLVSLAVGTVEVANGQARASIEAHTVREA